MGMTAKVQGRRSPRWAFMQRMTIPCFDGTDYLVRLRIVQTPWFGIYLHDIHKDDGDRAPHNHPWSFLSIVLRGHYTERVYPAPLEQPDRYVPQTHSARSMHRMGRTAAHRIVDASPGLKTLIVTGPRQASWGFFVDGELIDWSDYERHCAPSYGR
jgi:hypothetical protein